MTSTHLIVSYHRKGEVSVQALACDAKRNNIGMDGDDWLGGSPALTVVASNAGVVDCGRCLVSKTWPNATERAYHRMAGGALSVGDRVVPL